ncbi:MAG: cation transporter [Proteobacteria bacterium]|nr:cation transporter [Pseudomonadota bacterium]
MLTSLLIKKFISTPEATTDPKTRTSYGKLASVVGILCNVLLFAGKLLAGAVSGSIAIFADAINNLSDASGNVVSLAGFKLAAKKPDKKHPYGYARYEYLAGLAVSVMIVAIGISLGKESIEKIISPETTTFSWLSIGILVVSIIVKIWMSVFARHIGKKIDSDALVATAVDSRNDVLSTAAVLISTVVGALTGIAVIDGIMGVLVALFIVWSGFGLVRETISPLLGESPDPTLVTRIEEKVMSYDGVLGMHDLIVHDYGPGNQFASLHIEMPAERDPMESHDIIDNIENDFLENDNLQVSIHYDPISTADETVFSLRKELAEFVAGINPEFSIHDLRVVHGESHTNVLFDLVLPHDMKSDEEDEVVSKIRAKVKEINPLYIPKIKCEQSFASKE